MPLGGQGTGYNFGEILYRRLEGSVYHDVDGNGLRSLETADGEAGIEGVTITLSGTDFLGAAVGPNQTQTAADGSYSFEQLPPGTYTVTETQPVDYGDGFESAGNAGGDTSVNDTISAITLLAVAEGTGYDFGELAASIGGIVWRDLDEDGLRDPDEPAVQTTVRLLDDALATLASQTTDASGAYRFGGLLAGNYAVEFEAPNTGFSFSPQDQGGDDSIDSDVDLATASGDPVVGRSPGLTILAEERIDGLDAGFIHPCPLASVLYVDRDAAGANNGLSWNHALRDLQDALDLVAAGSCDAPAITEIWVAEGTYVPSDPSGRDATFQLEEVAIYGGFAGHETSRSARDWMAHPTVLSGEIGSADISDNLNHVVSGGGATAAAILDGFVVTRGYANGTDDVGGGIFNDGGSPVLRNLIVRDNRAATSADGGFGGGAANIGSGTPLFVNVLFTGNAAEAGGGVFNEVDATYVNVTFSGNPAVRIGGAAFNRFSSPTFRNVIMWGNTASVDDSMASSTATETVTYSLVEGGISGASNISSDPQFVDADGADDVFGTADDNPRLQSTSPAVDAANSNHVPAGVDLDLDGLPRLVDIAEVTDTGAGSPVVDMGSFEAQSTTEVTAIVRSTPASAATNAGSVTFTVTFDRSLSGLTAANFMLNSPGLTGSPAITSVVPTGGSVSTLWNVTVNGYGGAGSLRLDLDNADGLLDAAGASANISGLPFDSGETYAIDLVLPSASAPSDAGVWANGPSAFSWIAPSDTSGIASSHLHLGTSPGASDLGVVDVTGSTSHSVDAADGQTVFAFLIATDTVGNATMTDSSDGITFDLTPPDTAAPIDNGASIQGPAVFTWNPPTDDGSGVTELVLHVGTTSGGSQVFSGDVLGTTSFSQDGSHDDLFYAFLVAIDAAGNETRTHGTNGVRLDTVAPTASAPSDVGAFSGSPVTFTWGAPSDDGGGVASVTLHVGTSEGASDVFTGDVTGTTQHEVAASDGQTLFAHLVVEDFAENETTTPSSDGVTIDGAGPTASPPQDAGAFSRNPVRFTWSPPVDDGSGIASLVLHVGTSAGGSDVFTGDVTGTTQHDVAASDGQTLFAHLVTTDGVGNETATASSDGIAVDLAAPNAAAPQDEGQFSQSPALFTWNAPTDGGSGVASVVLEVGTTAGASDIFAGGDVSGLTEREVVGPAGATLFARLLVTDATSNETVTASSDGIKVLAIPTIPAPTDAGPIAENPVVFEWDDPSGGVHPIATVRLEVGTSEGGDDIFDGDVTGTNEAQVAGSLGDVLFARLVVIDSEGNAFEGPSSDGVQVVELIFGDDFETGTTDAWSSIVGAADEALEPQPEQDASATSDHPSTVAIATAGPGAGPRAPGQDPSDLSQDEVGDGSHDPSRRGDVESDVCTDMRQTGSSRLQNGEFDCGLERWQIVGKGLHVGASDADWSFDRSGSARIAWLDGEPSGLAQCVDLEPNLSGSMDVSILGAVRVDGPFEGLADLHVTCRVFPTDGCRGDLIATTLSARFAYPARSEWHGFEQAWSIGQEARSLHCAFTMTSQSPGLDGHLDALNLWLEATSPEASATVSSTGEAEGLSRESREEP
ncbi:MAG: hypothetical protein MPN21_15855 [Thermoanaerobaculia bacterium]|nr:hypothetical protein [Thermoanaerobaculia bacterium]